VGLGNPGPEYADTRHNAGFRLADRLAEQWEASPFRRGTRGREATATVAGQAVRLIKPQTYMNRSGAALAPLLADTAFDPSQDLLVLVDDVAIDLGRFRLRGAGSNGGHNGLRSIEATLRRQDYARLRIGVGPRPADAADLADFVLADFSQDELDTLEAQLDQMVDAVTCWIADGIERAMSQFNR
jgi:PTH1 family peptidyl-tRNA hydrolase